MARSERRGSFNRAAVLRNASQQRSKAANYGHLLLPKGVNIFKEEAGGRASLDILPYFVTDKRHPDRFEDEPACACEGMLWYRRPYKLHTQVGAANTKVICPTTFGKKCPICEYRQSLLDKGANWKDKSVSGLRPSDRALYYVVPKGMGKFDEKPHIWDISEFCFQNLLNNELGENDAFGAFAELEDGLTLRIRFSEEKLDNNSFAKASRIDFEARDYAYDEKVVQALTSLDDCLDAKDYGEVEKLFYDTSEVEDEDDARRVSREDNEDQNREPAPSMTRPKSNGAADTTRRPSRPAVEEKEPEQEQPRRSAAETKPKSAPAPKEESAGDCPSGHTFGADVDNFEECNECPVWSDCMTARQAMT